MSKQLLQKTRGLAAYHMFDPVVDLLLANGNQLADVNRWSVDQTGYTCELKQPIDFELLENTFEFPDNVEFNHQHSAIDYRMGEVVIFSKSPNNK